MKLRKVLVTMPVDAGYKERFAGTLPGAEFTYARYD